MLKTGGISRAATRGADTARRPTYKAFLLTLVIMVGSIFTPIKKRKKANPNDPIVPTTSTFPQSSSYP